MTYHNPKTPKPTASEKRAGKEWMAKVKQLPCVICNAPPPSDVHHCIHDRYSQKRASDFEVIPLCKMHHQSNPHAIHTNKRLWREKHGADYTYLDRVKWMIQQQESMMI
jgi:hypothetical protein